MTLPTALPEPTGKVFPETAKVRPNGQLEVGGCSLVDVAAEYGTPAYVIDEAGLRNQMRRYREGLRARWSNSEVLFASKSLPVLATYAIAVAEGLAIDVAGAGELLLALKAGADPSRIYLHGNAKSATEFELVKEHGVGTVIVDGPADVERIRAIRPDQLDVLIRVIPGVEANTHRSVATGGTDSKFGVPMAQATELIRELSRIPNVDVRGVHLHIGSQILDLDSFRSAVTAIASLGTFDTYDIGGGLGVNYNATHDAPSIESYLDAVTTTAAELLPVGARLLIEPGRSLVARSGVTIYEVNNVKTTGRTFVAVDGGLADQMNAALTQTRFTPLIANRADSVPNVQAQLVGRQCESGDLLVDRAELASPQAGDIVVLGATGAYGYTLANNYNGALKPPVVFCRDGQSRLAVRRETYDDYLATHEPASTITWSA